MSDEKNPLPNELQGLTMQFLIEPESTPLPNNPHPEYCHHPMVIYYDLEERTEFNSECVLPGQKGTKFKDDPDVEERPRSMIEAVCCAERDMSWCFICCICGCYTPALFIDFIYCAYSCCAFPFKKYERCKEEQEQNAPFVEDFNKFFSQDKKTLRNNTKYTNEGPPTLTMN